MGCPTSQRPTEASCWRSSFCAEIIESVHSNGIMVQVVEFERDEDGWLATRVDAATGLKSVVPPCYKLGPGQQLESLMAAKENLPTFRIYEVLDYTDEVVDAQVQELVHLLSS